MELAGGPHGDEFDDYNILYEKFVNKENLEPVEINIHAGERIDAIEFKYDDNTVCSRGGTGGTEQFVDIPGGEGISGIIAYNGKKMIIHGYWV